MRCPQCNHENITAFEFCEECLGQLPGRSETEPRAKKRDPFDFAEESVLETLRMSWPVEDADVARFPWNRSDQRVDVLLGRNAELKQARDVVRDVIRQWSGRLVLLLGDHGIGTSAFVARVKDEAKRLDAELVWSEAHCRDEPMRPYAVFGRLLRDRLQIPPQHDDWAAGERLLHAVTEAFYDVSGAEATETAYLVAFLVGFKIEGSPYLSPSEDDAQTLVPRASHSLTRLLCKLAEKQPAVYVLDAAHQAHAPALALMDLIAEGVTAAPVVLLAVGRPELRAAQPAWQSRDTIELRPMSNQDAENTLAVLLNGVENVPRPLIVKIVAKAGGNPYALRTIVRYLHESGVIWLAGSGRWEVDEEAYTDVAIPDTLRGVASARLQALTPAERTVLQQAAVIGPTFWFGALVMLRRLASEKAISSAEGVGKDTAIVDLRTSVESLLAREILVRVDDKALAGEETYAFGAEVDRALLYEQCPARTRHRFHRMVAHWLELQAPRFVEHNVAVIARHLEIGGEMWKAAQYYQRAGRQAESEFHNREATAFYEDALRLTSEEEVANRLNILFALGKLYSTAGHSERAMDTYREMLRVAWVMRSRAKGAVALNKLGQILRAVGQYDASRDHLVKALTLFRAIHDTRGVAGVLDDIGQLAWLQGDSAKALLTFERSKKLRVQLKDPRGLSLTLHYIGCVHLERGDYDAAEKQLIDALALRRKLSDRTGISMTLNNLGVIHWGRGDVVRAREAWRESLAISEEIGNRPVTSMLLTNLAESLLQEGAWDAAAPYLTEAETIAHQAGDRRTLGMVLLDQAWLAMARRDPAAAITRADRAIETARAIGNKRLLGLGQVAYGDITVGTSRSMCDAVGMAEGVACMRQGIETLATADCDVERAGALEQLAEVLRKIGRHREASAADEQAGAILAGRAVRPPRKAGFPWGEVPPMVLEEPYVPDERTPVSIPAMVEPEPVPVAEPEPEPLPAPEAVEPAPEPIPIASAAAKAAAKPAKKRAPAGRGKAPKDEPKKTRPKPAKSGGRNQTR